MSDAQKQLYDNGYVNPNKGNQYSTERRKQLSEIHKKRFSDGYVSPIRKKCRCIELNKEFESFIEAAHFFGVTASAISGSIRRKNKCKGFTFSEVQYGSH